MTYFDDVAQYNQERWEELAAQGLEYTRPILDLDTESALALVDPKGVAGDVSGKDVLCLAGAGGQQSAAFGILGTKVTVLDITETQLERDREAAAHYGIDVRTVQGDMRDLSVFDDGSFDLVHQAHSINFIPDPVSVFREVARVLRPGGLYALRCWNPFAHWLYDNWNGEGYVVKARYEDAELHDEDPRWEFEGFDGTEKKVVGPREFRHTLEYHAQRPRRAPAGPRWPVGRHHQGHGPRAGLLGALHLRRPALHDHLVAALPVNADQPPPTACTISTVSPSDSVTSACPSRRTTSPL